MIFAPLAGLALVVTVSTGPIHDADPTILQLSTREKSAAMQPLVQRATDCIAAHIAADPRYSAQSNGELGDLIVDSIPACLQTVRALIDAHDRYFGEGTGEAFFMGPYLDVLPTAVARRMKAPGSRREAVPGTGATARP